MALSSLAVDASLFIITIHYLLFAVRYLLDIILQHSSVSMVLIIHRLLSTIYHVSSTVCQWAFSLYYSLLLSYLTNHSHLYVWLYIRNLHHVCNQQSRIIMIIIIFLISMCFWWSLSLSSVKVDTNLHNPSETLHLLRSEKPLFLRRIALEIPADS